MKRFLIIAIPVVVLVLVAVFVYIGTKGPPDLTSKHRIAWAKTAISEIESEFAQPNFPYDELGALDWWHSETLIRFEDGSWLVFRNICSKSDYRIRDLFIARTESGEWFHSTFHFCIDAIVLKMVDQAPTSKDFIREFKLSPFDGDPESCLDTTWEPGDGLPNL